MLRPVFHLTVFVINSFVLWYDQMYVVLPLPVKEMEKLPLQARSMFLTIWCLILQTLYHFVALLNDLMGSNAETSKKPPIIRRIKDTLFSLAFGVAIYVSFAFWSIYAIDKELIFPEYIAKLYHPSFNHVMHTTVTLFIIIELLTSSSITYPSRKVSVTIMLTFYFTYLAWFFIIYAITGAWVYPVFQPLNWPLRLLFVVFSVLCATGFHLFGEKLNSYVNMTKKQSHANGYKNGIANGKKNH